MAEETSEQTGQQQTPAAQVKRPAGTAPSIPTRETERPTRTTSSHTCEVLKDSCEEPAKWVAKTADGVEIYVCEEHKPLIAENYPDTTFEYEEL